MVINLQNNKILKSTLIVLLILSMLLMFVFRPIPAHAEVVAITAFSVFLTVCAILGVSFASEHAAAQAYNSFSGIDEANRIINDFIQNNNNGNKFSNSVFLSFATAIIGWLSLFNLALSSSFQHGNIIFPDIPELSSFYMGNDMFYPFDQPNQFYINNYNNYLDVNYYEILRINNGDVIADDNYTGADKCMINVEQSVFDLNKHYSITCLDELNSMTNSYEWKFSVVDSINPVYFYSYKYGNGNFAYGTSNKSYFKCNISSDGVYVPTVGTNCTLYPIALNPACDWTINAESLLKGTYIYCSSTGQWTFSSGLSGVDLDNIFVPPAQYEKETARSYVATPAEFTPVTSDGFKTLSFEEVPQPGYAPSDIASIVEAKYLTDPVIEPEPLPDIEPGADVSFDLVRTKWKLKTQWIYDTFAYFSDWISTLNSEVPVIPIHFGNSRSRYNYNYGGDTYALNLNWYSEYKSSVDVIISGLLWLLFLWRLLKHLSGIISGADPLNDDKTDKHNVKSHERRR